MYTRSAAADGPQVLEMEADRRKTQFHSVTSVWAQDADLDDRVEEHESKVLGRWAVEAGWVVEGAGRDC